MAAITRSLVSAGMSGLPLITKETVVRETPANLATSMIIGLEVLGFSFRRPQERLIRVIKSIVSEPSWLLFVLGVLLPEPGLHSLVQARCTDKVLRKRVGHVNEIALDQIACLIQCQPQDQGNVVAIRQGAVVCSLWHEMSSRVRFADPPATETLARYTNLASYYLNHSDTFILRHG